MRACLQLLAQAIEGVAFFWKIANSVSIKAHSPNYIDAEVHLDNTELWRLTCFYGYPERSRRKESWDLLRFLASQSTKPWVVLGDFNDMLYAKEKEGRHIHPNWLLNGFKEAVHNSGLSDLGMESYRFTWEGGEGQFAGLRKGWIVFLLTRIGEVFFR